MGDGLGGGGLVATLGPAVLTERDVGAGVNEALVGVVVVGQQALLELALIPERSLWGGEGGRGGGGGVDSIWVLLHSLFIHIGGGEPSDLKGQTEQKHYCAVQPAGKYPA